MLVTLQDVVFARILYERYEFNLNQGMVCMEYESGGCLVLL
jgi:hypothetical protein